MLHVDRVDNVILPFAAIIFTSSATNDYDRTALRWSRAVIALLERLPSAAWMIPKRLRCRTHCAVWVLLYRRLVSNLI